MSSEEPLGAETSGPQKPRSDLIVPYAVKELAVRFHALFAGMERAHGTYTNINWDDTRPTFIVDITEQFERKL